MTEQFSRTARILGENTINTLSTKHVTIFGLGGVGGYVAEALVRSGIGKFDLIDHDRIDITNLNRQIIATHKTIGRDKAEAMRERMLDINPDAEITVHPCFFLPENADSFPFGEYDYVVDAVDTVTAKIELVMRAKDAGVPVISSMGAGNKLDATAFRVADIYETKVCPLARVMRRELKKRNVEHLKVVYSEEKPIVPAEKYGVQQEAGFSHDDAAGQTAEEGGSNVARRQTPGSVAFVPSVAGLIIAGEVVKDLALAAQR